MERSHPSGRERLHNPNYPPPMQSYGPSMPQPPAQPGADPFRARRDPFYSTTTSDRREQPFSHGVYAQNGTSRIETLHPAPAPPQSPFHGGFGGNPGNHARRSSIGAYSTGAREPQPPPLSSVLNRQMPPPAPSPKESPSPAYPRGHLPNPSSFPSLHDGPGHNSNHRPSSSMSISSIMGSDPGIAPRGPPLKPPFGARISHAPNGTYTQPTSPSYQRRSGYLAEVNGNGRPRTPERRNESQFVPPFARAGPAMSPAGHAPHGLKTEYGIHTSERLPQHAPQSSPMGGTLPPRPFSQPAGPDLIAQGQGYRPPAYGPIPPQPTTSQSSLSAREGPQEHTRDMRDVYERNDQRAYRDRASSDIDTRKGSLLFQPYARPTLDGLHTGVTQHEPAQYNGRHDYQPRPAKLDGLQRNDYSKQMDLPRTPRSPYMPQMEKEPKQHPYAIEPVYTSAFIPAEHTLHNKQPTERPEFASFNSNSTMGDGGRRTPIVDEHLRRSIEDGHALQKSILGLDGDRMRRPDRASPLPQAVQGAQAQPAGSNRAPGIKSEFGRMFSGLGSGVGSTPVPSASFPPPPSAPRSPVVDYTEPDKSGCKSPNGNRTGNAGSRGGRKGNKRVYERDLQVSSDGPEGKTTPFGSTKEGKRSKYALPAHHHHHHPPTLHHHHHHRKLEDENATQQSLSATSSPLAAFKFPPAPVQISPPASSPVPHHHHHHHPPHHHHHPPKSSPAIPQPPAQRLPTTTILTKPLLQSVSHLPRLHLGSQLYAPAVHLPAITSTNIGSSHTYTSSPNVLPDFESRENCTFTIRVPRYYLSHEARQAICADRQIWGTDVYTDDSDPIAAAIHSGWIRGAWSPDVDVSLLNLDQGLSSTNGVAAGGTTTDSEEGKRSRNTLKKLATSTSSGTDVGRQLRPAAKRLITPPTSGPIEPPQDMDMHLTLLILPTLERYATSVWHGIKSRAWGDNHEGMSFKIDGVEFVDEALDARYEERGSQAKRRRIQQSMSMRGTDAGIFDASAVLSGLLRSATASTNGGLIKTSSLRGGNNKQSVTANGWRKATAAAAAQVAMPVARVAAVAG